MQNFLLETERDSVDGLGWLFIFMTIWATPCKVSSCCFAVGSGSTLVSKTITLKTGSNEIVKVMTWAPLLVSERYPGVDSFDTERSVI